MDFTPEQMEYAMKLTMEDLMEIGYRIDTLSEVTAHFCDDIINADINSLSTVIVRQIVVDNMDTQTVKKMGNIVTRLRDRLNNVYNDETAVGITKEMERIMKGEVKA